MTAGSRAVLVGVLGLVAAGLLAVWLLRPRPAPPPAEVASDPLLTAGRALYLDRCVSCHGTTGRGDGPIAATLTGPPPQDLTDGHWKHGQHPEQVVDVIARGVPGSSMAGWSPPFRPDEVRALAAYVYHLARQPVPEALRKHSRF